MQPRKHEDTKKTSAGLPRSTKTIDGFLRGFVPSWLRFGPRCSVAVWIAGVVLAGRMTGAAQTQRPQPVFRSGAQLTVVDVTVKDSGGRAVEGLKASDFSLTEDGVAQAVTFAEFQRIEPSSSDAPPPPGAPVERTPADTPS